MTDDVVIPLPEMVISLPETTTDRLLLAADIIELTPERYDQRSWVSTGELNDGPLPCDVAGLANEHLCGSTACVAGWGVLLDPSVGLHQVDWDAAGAHAFGLDIHLAAILFSEDLSAEPADVAEILRHLAKLGEGERSFEMVKRHLPRELVEMLEDGVQDDDDEDDG